MLPGPDDGNMRKKKEPNPFSPSPGSKEERKALFAPQDMKAHDFTQASV
jgi:hypothetical protein